MTEFLVNFPPIIFWVFVASYLVGAFFIIFHLLKFGVGPQEKIITAVFLLGLAALLLFGFYSFSNVDWQILITDYLRI